jgi:cyclophilin family peptidyl-prolyl cis-trans isomerase
MKQLLLLLAVGCSLLAFSQPAIELKNKDRRKDIEMVTTEGTIVLRLSDSTPIHRDDFLRLVKTHNFDSMLFHRVIKNFMIQSGDRSSKNAQPGQPMSGGGLGYTLPAEFRDSLFHKRGALAAARDNNPEKRSGGGQFYLVQGRTFTDQELDSIEVARLEGRKLSQHRRHYYKTIGGTPQLDSNYTVYGEVVKGMDVVDKIASTLTSQGPDKDRPLQDMRILSVRLIRRDKKLAGTF